MSSEKRPGSGFGSGQLVKRQKSDANIGNNRSVAVVNGSAQSGALIQAVSCAVVKRGPSNVLTQYFQVARTSGLQAPAIELNGMFLVIISD